MIRTKITPATVTLITALGASTAFAASMDWDTDSDGMVNETEFMQGMDSETSYTDLDANSDGMLDMNEIGDTLDDESYAAADMDGDSMLTQEEYNASMFDTYDANDDGLLDDTETAELDTDMDLN